MPNVVTSQPIDTATLDRNFARADVQFDGLDHSTASYQGRVFGVGSTIWRTTMLGAVALAPVVDAVASPAKAISLAAVFLFVGAVVVQVALRESPRTVPATA